MKFGDEILYVYTHHFNLSSSKRMGKNAIFIKQEGEVVYLICEGNKSVTKTNIDSIQEREIQGSNISYNFARVKK